MSCNSEAPTKLKHPQYCNYIKVNTAKSILFKCTQIKNIKYDTLCLHIKLNFHNTNNRYFYIY